MQRTHVAFTQLLTNGSVDLFKGDAFNFCTTNEKKKTELKVMTVLTV